MPSAHTWVTIGSGDPPPIPLAPVRVLDPLFSGACVGGTKTTVTSKRMQAVTDCEAAANADSTPPSYFSYNEVTGECELYTGVCTSGDSQSNFDTYDLAASNSASFQTGITGKYCSAGWQAVWGAASSTTPQTPGRTVLPLEDCKSACLASPTCAGITVGGGETNNCFLCGSFVLGSHGGWTSYPRLTASASGTAPPSAYDFNIENPSEDKRTYSSHYSATTIESMLDSGMSTKSWRSKTATANQWVQIDLGAVKFVVGVVTQGHLQSDQWVKSYTVSTSTAGDTWLPVNNAEHFNGNTDKGTRVRNDFALVAARYVRIYAQTWQSVIVMRAGVVVTRGTPPWIPYRSYSILALAANYSCSIAQTNRMRTQLYFLLL